MLQDCINIFSKHPEMNKLILDTYTPADGTYIILDENDDDFKIKELLEVKQDKKTKLLNITEEERKRISFYDYNSKLLDMNKPIDPKKIIQSNNYLSFWIKKESLSNGKLTNERIDNYFEILSNPYLKYSKSKNDKALYALVEKYVGDINHDKLMKIHSWVKKNIFNLQANITGKDYLKLFFICHDTDFEKEGLRYIIPNIYNKNDYNIKVGDNILGLPNENMGLNSKKPYLENKSRKFTIPLLVDTNQIMLRKKFFDYLWNLSSSGQYNIYFDIKANKIYSYDNNSLPTSDFNGYYLRIRKDKNEAAILDMDIITSYKPQLKTPIIIENVIGIDVKKLDGYVYGRLTKLNEVRDVINNVFFSKFLLSNLFTEPGDISISDSVLKESILVIRERLINWFYKGYEGNVDFLLDKVSLKLIISSIAKGYVDKVQHQYNLRMALLEYFRGGNIRMADIMKDIRHNLRIKMNSKEYGSIDTDEEYYYAVGQLIRFFISLNKSSKKNHSLLNPFINTKNNKLLKERLVTLFKKYNYSIEENSLRFNNLYNLVLSYESDTETDTDYIIAGYISNNLIYEKKEDK